MSDIKIIVIKDFTISLESWDSRSSMNYSSLELLHCMIKTVDLVKQKKKSNKEQKKKREQ